MTSVTTFVPGMPVDNRDWAPTLQLPKPSGLDQGRGAPFRKASRWAVIGASREQRGFFTRDISAGNLQRRGGWIYGTTDTPHELHTGARCYIAMQPKNSTNPMDQKFRGHFTFVRTGASTFKGYMPRSDSGEEYPDGVSTWQGSIISLDHWSPASVIGWLNMHPSIKGSINLVCASVIGGTDTTENRARFNDVLAFNPDGIFLVGGIGNDRLSSQPDETTLGNIDWMLAECFSRGIVVVQSPGSLPDNTIPVADLTVGARLARRYSRLSQSRANHVILDEISPVIDPATGYSKGIYLVDNVHQQPEGAMVIAAANADTVAKVVEVRDPLIRSILDRYAADPSHPNIYDGGWSSTGISASTQDTKATGTVDSCVSISSTGNASRAVACSLVAENSAYISRFAMTAAAASDAFTFDFIGSSGALMRNRLKPDTEYEVACRVNLTVSGASVVGGWEVKAEATMTYDDQSNVSATLAACPTYQGDQAKAIPAKHVVRTSPGTVYPVFRFRTPKNMTACSQFGIRFKITFAAAGTATLDVYKLSVSEVV